MSTDKKSSFFAYFKKYTPIISLLSTVLGIAQFFITQNRVAIVVMAGFGAVLLIAYNIWIACATERSVVDPSIRLPQYSKRFRVWVHSISSCLLAVCWIIVACMAWPKHSGYVFYEIGLPKLAIKQLESYLKKPNEDYYAHYKLVLCYKKLGQLQKCVNKLKTLKKGNRNKPGDPNQYLLKSPVAYDVYYELAQCYKELREPKNYVEILESLLDQERIFEKFDKNTKNEKKSEIHTEIALFLISSDYIKGIENQHKMAWRHIEKACSLENARLQRRDRPPNPYAPRVFWIHGFLTAYRAGGKGLRSQVEESFGHSQSAIERMKLSEKSRRYRFCFSQHCYWFGRALFELKDYESAKKELASGLDIAQKDDRLSDSLEHFYFRLGQNEHRLTGDKKIIQGYWKNLSEEYYLEIKLLFAGFDYLCRAKRARVDSNQEQELKYLSQAKAEFSQAESVGLNSEELSFRLGQFYFEREDYETASDYFEEASEKNPSMYRAFYWRVVSLYMDGRIADANEALNHAKKLKPGELGAYKECVILLVTISEDEDRSSAEKIGLLKKALTYTKPGIDTSQTEEDEHVLNEIRTLRGIALNSLAFIYAERGEKLKQAREYIDEALKIARSQGNPDNEYYLDTKAWVIIRGTESNTGFSKEEKLSKYMEAKKLLNECLKSLPRDDMDAKEDVLYHMEYLEKLVEQLDPKHESVS